MSWSGARRRIWSLRRSRKLLESQIKSRTVGLEKFNESLKSEILDLKNARDLLEQQVLERSTELQKVNEALQVQNSERAKAEESLREIEQRYRTTADAIPVLVWQSGPDRLCTYFNTPWLEFTGRTLEQELGNGWIKGVHPDDFQHCLHSYVSAFDRRESFSIEYRLRHRSGEYRWILDRGVPQLSLNGKFLGYIGGAIDIHDSKLAARALQRSREELRMLASRLQTAREEERARLAREIHDELSGSLTALKADLSLLPDRAAKDRTLFLKKLGSMSELVDRTLANVRTIVTELRPIVLDKFGLVAAIEWQAGEFQDRAGIACETRLPTEEISLDPDRSTAVFRILQEALTNVARHSSATKVVVDLRREGESLVLTVRDNGKGIDEKAIHAHNSIGLLGMRERALSFGGSVEVSCLSPSGTLVRVSIPIQ